MADAHAPAGPDGARISALLRGSLKVGAATLGELTEAAVRRLVKGGKRRSGFFTPGERDALARALAAINSTAELLGRARVRRRMAKAAKFAEATDFTCFDDGKPLAPLAPLEALDYFRSLIPMLGVTDPGRWAADQHRVAFTLAQATEQILLERVQKVIADTIAGRTDDKQAVRDVRGTLADAKKKQLGDVPARVVKEVLDKAGLSAKRPFYAENVVRTNLMDAMATGLTREMQHPDVADYFPAWQYLGVKDGRQRKSHEAHFDRYYPNSASFAEVRDSVDGAFSGFNCRCLASPVDRHTWAELQAKGASLSRFAEEPERFAAKDSGGFTGEKKDSLGRRICYEGGRRVKCEKAEKPKGEKGTPATVDSMHAAIEKARAGKLTASKVADIASQLQHLKVAELKELKKRLTVKASGIKAELAKKIAERALAKAGIPAKPAKAAPKSAAKPARKASPRKSASPQKPADPMKGHPLFGKSREAAVRQLVSEGAPYLQGAPPPVNPRGYDLKAFPKGVDGPKLTAGVVGAVKAAQAKTPGARPTVRELYDRLGGGASLHDFQGALVKMSKDGAISLHPWTTSLGGLKDLAAVIPFDRDLRYFVDLGRK